MNARSGLRGQLSEPVDLEINLGSAIRFGPSSSMSLGSHVQNKGVSSLLLLLVSNSSLTAHPPCPDPSNVARRMKKIGHIVQVHYQKCVLCPVYFHHATDGVFPDRARYNDTS